MPFHALFYILFHHRKLFNAAICNVDIIIINLLKSCIKLGEYWWMMCGGWATVSVCHGAASCQVHATTHLSPPPPPVWDPDLSPRDRHIPWSQGCKESQSSTSHPFSS